MSQIFSKKFILPAMAVGIIVVAILGAVYLFRTDWMDGLELEDASESFPMSDFDADLEESLEQKIEDKITEMSISEKAGQLLIFAAKGTSMTAEYREELKQIKPGGVIIMGYNIGSQLQLKEFVDSIQATNEDTQMFIAIDQEGGWVKRISWDDTPGQLEWQNMPNTEICLLAQKRAKILKESGINLNFSPVVDLRSADSKAFINDRVISGDPIVVTEKAGEYVRCTEAQGVATTLKHFPGHGATVEDSHFVLPTISKSKTEWLASDAYPFLQIPDASMVMVGHLVYKDLDVDHPASQSELIISEVLRGELDYQGLVITDDMAQLHTSTGVSEKDALRNAFNAGVDIVLYVANKKSNIKIHEELVELIENGEIAEDLVDQKIKNILQKKKELKLIKTN